MSGASRKRHRRRFLGVGSAVAGMLAVTVATGCGGSGSASGSSSSSGSGGGAQGKTVTVGLSSVLSGPSSVYSQLSQGVKAYLRMTNEQGGVNGYTFKTSEKDNAYQPAQAVAATRELANSGVLEVIEVGTPPVQAVIPIADQLGVPILAAANGDFFTPPPSENLFGENPQYSRLPLFDAQFIMTNLHTKRFALAYENDDVGTPASKVVPKYVQAHGGQVVTSIPVDADASDFSAIASRLKRSGATVVQAFLGTAPFAGLQKAADAIGYHPTWITIFTSLGPAYTDLVGSLADGTYVNAFLKTTGPAEQAFEKGIKKYYPKLVTSFLAKQGWTIGAMTVKAVEAATKNGGELTRDSYIKALESFDGAPAGLLPSVVFDNQSHAAARKAAMYKYNGTTPKQVTPYKDIPSLQGG